MVRTASDSVKSSDEAATTAAVDDVLHALEEELRALHQSCLTAGHSPRQISEFAAPILQLTARGRTQRRTARGFGILVAVLGLLALGRLDWSALLLSTYGRSALIHKPGPFINLRPWVLMSGDHRFRDRPWSRTDMLLYIEGRAVDWLFRCMALISMTFYFDFPTTAIVNIIVCNWSTVKAVLPLWDWTQMYYKDCLIPNPSYVYRKLKADDCLICESMDVIPGMVNASHAEVAEEFIKSDLPVIIEDAIRDWNLSSEAFSYGQLAKIFLDSDINGSIYPCTFSSNLRLRGDNYFHTLLHRLKSGDMSSKRWYAHWENCGKTSSKTLRRHHPRPYFLPPMVDTSEPNWVFLASNYRGRLFKDVSIVSDMLWLAQIHGSMLIKLRPKTPCNTTCVELTELLEEGQALIYTDRMWHFEYLPGEEMVNVAIGGGGMFES